MSAAATLSSPEPLERSVVALRPLFGVGSVHVVPVPSADVPGPEESGGPDVYRSMQTRKTLS